MELYNWVMANMDVFKQIVEAGKQLVAAIIVVWGLICLICSWIVKLWPVLPVNSRWLPVIKFIAKIGALNKNVTSGDRPN